jgi:predicted membrane GTPase involved in stress response
MEALLLPSSCALLNAQEIGLLLFLQPGQDGYKGQIVGD